MGPHLYLNTVNVKRITAVVRCISVRLGICLAERGSLSFAIILSKVYSRCAIARLHLDVMPVSTVCIPETQGLVARISGVSPAGLGNQLAGTLLMSLGLFEPLFFSHLESEGQG